MGSADHPSGGAPSPWHDVHLLSFLARFTVELQARRGLLSFSRGERGEPRLRGRAGTAGWGFAGQGNSSALIRPCGGTISRGEQGIHHGLF